MGYLFGLLDALDVPEASRAALLAKLKAKNLHELKAAASADGLDEAGADLYQLVLDVASGKQTCAEKKGFREISIFKDGVVL